MKRALKLTAFLLSLILSLSLAPLAGAEGMSLKVLLSRNSAADASPILDAWEATGNKVERLIAPMTTS